MAANILRSERDASEECIRMTEKRLNVQRGELVRALAAVRDDG
jgi:hypothetical protein